VQAAYLARVDEVYFGVQPGGGSSGGLLSGLLGNFLGMMGDAE
jgi:hypothetical protein